MQKKNRYINFSTGSTIMEALIAMAVVGVILTGAALSLTYSVKNSSEAAYREIATRYAQEVIETLKKDKTTRTWAVFSASPANNTLDQAYCVPSNFSSILDASNNNTLTEKIANTNMASCDVYTSSNPAMDFYRTVTKTAGTANSINYVVRVYWNVGVVGQERSVVTEQVFYKGI